MAFAKQGRVILVGAGPGDPELLTLKGRRWLGEADVVLYDFLIHPNLLALCRPDAELICVGKRKGLHVNHQTSINAQIVTHAVAGKTVVRLKGGDPFVFGRGGEELLAAKSAGIPVEVVPGVSSGWAVPAYAGIPLTFREVSRSVAMVSGSLSTGAAPEAHQLPIADTVVVFMAVSHLDDIVAAYVKNGHFTTQTPVAVIYRGTLAAQSTLISTLGNVAADVRQAELSSPSLLVIGEVVALAPQLNWISDLPLFGHRVVVLRAAHQSAELTEKLSHFGAEVVQLPVLKFEKKPELLNLISPQYLSDFSMIIFTSPNGVRHFMDHILSRGMDARGLIGKQIVAIGPKTAQTLRSYGISADFQPEHYHSEGIAEMLPVELSDQRILMPVAAGADGQLSSNLEKRGAQVTVLKTYETVMPDHLSFTLMPHDWIVFTSPSTATHFFQSVWDGQTPIRCVSIGKKTSAKIHDHWSESIFEAEFAGDDGVVAAIISQAGGH